MINAIKEIKSRQFDRQMLKDLYSSNGKFKAYVDRCCKQDKRSVEEELSLALVQEVGKGYLEAGAEGTDRIQAANSTYAPVGECV